MVPKMIADATNPHCAVATAYVAQRHWYSAAMIHAGVQRLPISQEFVIAIADRPTDHQTLTLSYPTLAVVRFLAP
jgi:hypothetical protein